MENIFDLYVDELTKSEVNYFIFDSKQSYVENNEKKDVEFIQYVWQKNFYNQVKEGDLFIYRRPTKSSSNRKFYFFGSGRIYKIIQKDNFLIGLIDKTNIFKDHIIQDDLDNFIWHFKDKKNDNWEHFFNQYGMNKIKKDDFLNLIGLLNLNSFKIQKEDIETRNKILKQINKKNFFVDDNQSKVNIRNGQNEFSKIVKTNYNYSCALCNIKNKDFLIASHIVPWSQDKLNRLNPRNGLCLCVFHDKAFDKGYITLDDSYRVQIAKKLDDKIIDIELNKHNNIKIKLPKDDKPDKEFLEYHRKNIFKVN